MIGEFLSCSMSGVRFIVCVQRRGGGQDGGKTNSGGKSRPCIDTDVLAKAKCSMDPKKEKHAGDKQKPWSNTRFSTLIIKLQRLGHVSD